VSCDIAHGTTLARNDASFAAALLSQSFGVAFAAADFDRFVVARVFEIYFRSRAL
jgi:hypothetical protein